MKTRIISGFVLAVILAVVVLSGQIVFASAVFILALIGINEFYSSVSSAGYRPVRIIGFLSCISILLIGMNGSIKYVSDFISAFNSGNYLALLIFAAIVVLSSLIIFMHNRYNLIDIALTAFGILYVVFLFSFAVLTRNLADGRYLIWLIFIGAFATDTFAYFTGVLIGRTKILPVISPKKSLEGSIGGIAGCILVSVLYGLLLDNVFSIKTSIPLYHYVIIGFICAIISQIGDWTASAIKRYVKVKDYGRIMPGHGGVLDRFDSILFVAPVIYFYISMVIQ